MLDFLNVGHGAANKPLVECLQSANGQTRTHGRKEEAGGAEMWDRGIDQRTQRGFSKG